MVEEESVTGWGSTGNDQYKFIGESGTDRGPYIFLNFRCFSISGYKYEDMVGDGDLDSDDKPVAGWVINLYKKDSSGNWAYYDMDVTDASGYYNFMICSPGEYKVEEADKAGWQATNDISFTFSGVSGYAFSWDFFNFKQGCISGYKWYDKNRNGVLDTGESYVKGIKIELYKDGDLIATDTTDANGKYSFCSLGPGNYVVKEVPPTTNKNCIIWAQVYPDGDWEFAPFLSGSNINNANFGNAREFTEGLTWGYWKTHTKYGPAQKADQAYKKLSSNPMSIDKKTADGDYLVENDAEALWVFNNCGSSGPCNASGDGRSLFRAQLLALHMNLIKFSTIGDMYYHYTGDDYDGWTVSDIYDLSISLLTDGYQHDFHDLLSTIDRINNNGNYGPGDHVLSPDC
jgi:hypothetical protein